jgi:hypothetical protein
LVRFGFRQMLLFKPVFSDMLISVMCHDMKKKKVKMAHMMSSLQGENLFYPIPAVDLQ